ncbi:hypothetical protein K435DRAFT_873053 [Dendrothele bispora CBS 962.96]|uniref:Ribosomal RNA large subunit methyltransferase K/L-like methyltransferase domain-containing protein n=1 Tax=Dendrothele bispora (strain CBS 962.96) TaxID=1314807 RepID=A0A4S8L0D9_DENBC|nr:hypothetical protein K435DRAFT_873053 [Dendrothele bispora CBS 962.96]
MTASLDKYISADRGRVCSRLIKTFDVKKRNYFGNTSMESEVSLLMANQTLASPGKLIYDPFLGTGSMAYPVAYFGAQVFGSDIDGRQMRGKVHRAYFEQQPSTVDLLTFDIIHNPWRCGGLFDAIVTDPPYGVRAGAKRLGRKKELDPERMALYFEHRSNPRPDDSPYIPPTKPYELSNLAVTHSSAEEAFVFRALSSCKQQRRRHQMHNQTYIFLSPKPKLT